jgi:hypothetical protein
MRSLHFRPVLFASTLLVASGCGGVVGPSQNTIEEFSGFVDPLGEGEQHDFNVSRNGEIEVRLSALEPSANVFLTLAIGQYVGGACGQVLGVSIVPLNRPVAAAVVTGRHCAQVFDEGFLTERVAYTLRVSHP